MPTPMEKQPEPALEYVPIPKERYTSPEFARLEWERMWTRVWLLAGRESGRARSPGDYFTFEIGTESVLVIRQRDGSLAARYNVCMHRGNRLREPGRGHARRASRVCSTAGAMASTAGSSRRSIRSASRRAARGAALAPARALRDLGGLRVRVTSIRTPRRCASTSA